ncbi:MAG: hypothetical protein KQ78_02198 [Candidatus Izimaplasma bacterium HR2]|nr:MAG: hypothetical protein KQ78_02198 [Candidatus Izimaplasma bacterium HR2]
MKKNYGLTFKEFVESKEYKLLSEYINAQTKVKIKCNKGHIYEVRPYTFKQGHICPKCSNKCPIQAKEQFLELITKDGYKLISKYKGTKTKVKLRCSRNHIWEVKPNTFKTGKRCIKCAGLCPIQAEKEFKELLVSVGYELLSEYKNVATKVKIRCNKGHEYEVRPNNFKKGRRCPRCPIIQASKEFKELVESMGYKLLSEYIDTKTKLKLRCKEGHEYSVTPSSFKQGSRCPICFERRSQKEIDILNYVKSSINEEVISSDRTQIINPRTGNYLELDIWIPELNKAIEFNGTYWHSSEYSIYKDEIKREYCNANGIDLKVIEEFEYDAGLELCLDGISNFLEI